MNESKIHRAIFARLQADTTLRSLLGKSSFPFGIYREDGIPSTPSFPMVTLEWFGGILSDNPGSEEGHMAMNVRVYSASNIEAIHAQIKKSLRTTISPISVSNVDIHKFRLTNKGQEHYIDMLEVQMRLDTYVIGYSMYDEI